MPARRRAPPPRSSAAAWAGEAEDRCGRGGCRIRSGRPGRRPAWRPARGRARCPPRLVVTKGSNSAGADGLRDARAVVAHADLQRQVHACPCCRARRCGRRGGKAVESTISPPIAGSTASAAFFTRFSRICTSWSRLPRPAAGRGRNPRRCADARRSRSAPARARGPAPGGCSPAPSATGCSENMSIRSTRWRMRSASSWISWHSSRSPSSTLDFQQLGGAADAGQRVLDLVRQHLRHRRGAAGGAEEVELAVHHLRRRAVLQRQHHRRPASPAAARHARRRRGGAGAGCPRHVVVGDRRLVLADLDQQARAGYPPAAGRRGDMVASVGKESWKNSSAAGLA